MYYYYDVLLNFNEENELYEFYEWEEKDSIEFIKKIPLFRVSTNTLKDFFMYKIKFDSSFLEKIKDKTILKNTSSSLDFAFLISDTKNALALELNEEGMVISRSKLLLSDENNLNEMMFTMKETKLDYEHLKKYKVRKDIRQIGNIKKIIKCEIDTLYDSNHLSKLKYLYYEWFNKVNEDKETIVKDMYTLLESNDIKNLERIYDLIKLSYKVN